MRVIPASLAEMTRKANHFDDGSPPCCCGASYVEIAAEYVRVTACHRLQIRTRRRDNPSFEGALSNHLTVYLFLKFSMLVWFLSVLH